MPLIKVKLSVQQQIRDTTQNMVILLQLLAQVELGVLEVEKHATSVHLDTSVHPQ